MIMTRYREQDKNKIDEKIDVNKDHMIANMSVLKDVDRTKKKMMMIINIKQN
jgi:hypothetical protein